MERYIKKLLNKDNVWDNYTACEKIKVSDHLNWGWESTQENKAEESFKSFWTRCKTSGPSGRDGSIHNDYKSSFWC